MQALSIYLSTAFYYCRQHNFVKSFLNTVEEYGEENFQLSAS